MDAATSTTSASHVTPAALEANQATTPSSAWRAATVTYVDPAPSIRRIVGEGWHSRHLLPLLALNLIKRRYSKTYLGRTWLFLRPVLDIVAGAVLFGGVLRVTSQDGTPYLLFFTAGILGWRVLERTVYWVTRSFDRFRFTKKVDLPLLLVPLGGCSPAVFDLLVYFVLLLVIALGYLVVEGHMWLRLGPETLAAVAGIFLCLVFGLSIGLWTSVINVRTRDIRQVMRYVLQFWLFATPVIYPVSRLPADLQPIAQANPMAAPIELVKYGLLRSSGSVPLLSVVWSCGAACLFVAAGLWFFSRRASNFMGPAGWASDEDEDNGLI